MAHISNVQKPEQSNYTELTVAKGSGSSYQPLGYWWSCMSGKQAKVDTCQLEGDGGEVSSKREGSGGVLPKLSGEASRSRGFEVRED